MATTLANIRTVVNQVFKRTDKTAETTEAINETLREIIAALDPHKLQDQRWVPTVVGQEEYALPDTLLRLNHPVRLIDSASNNNSSLSYQLEFLTKSQYDYWEPNPNATTVVTGKPWAYAMWKNAILLTNIPDKATYRIEINLGGVPTDLSAEVDTMIFADVWKETVKAGALARLYALMTLPERASFWREIFLNGYTGDGGFNQMKKIEAQNMQAPYVVQYRDF